ncbi:MAG TPA: hypothetical protein VHM70_29350 [Polyangiaceae bacterium]|nr:hypothetical protein [Polyangiaceae bacterium]
MSKATAVPIDGADPLVVSMRCDTCGNIYDKGFTVLLRNGQKLAFDCFECAISKLAPCCASCECRVIGHGVEANNRFYCCAHCARKEGEVGLHDRASGGEAR